MDTSEIVICCILLCVEISMICMGIGILLPSPSIFKMNRKKDYCTREKKFIWQKEYKSETLCKLSEIEKAFKRGGFSKSYELCLKLKSGKDIVVFTKPSGKEGAPDFDRQVKEINDFLCNNNEQYRTIQERFYLLFSIVCIIMGPILLYNTLLTALRAM